MFAGYNTNGFAHHRLADAIDIIADLGYGGIALTPDVHHLDPFATDHKSQAAEFRKHLRRRGLRCVVETGARFLLDPRRKHQPTLLSSDPEERATRHRFLGDAIELAMNVGAEHISFWSGTPNAEAAEITLFERLAAECRELAELADCCGVRIAFEPEPGMFIDTMERFKHLFFMVNHPAFGLTIDIGHLVCNGELPVSRFLTEWKHVLWNVHIEDMRRGVHDHVRFGEGEVDFADVFAGLRAAGYAGGVYVELSRHSHDAVNTARRAKAFLGAYGL